MEKLLNVVLFAATLLASTSLAMAQDNGSSIDRQRALDPYAQSNAPTQYGPWENPRDQTQRHPTVSPFTWAEKRAFDYQNGND
jgi:hypothetical protein